MFTAILREIEALGVEEAECLFCHCSVQNLGIPVHLTPRFLDELIEFIGDERTLFLPSLAFSNHESYEKYIKGGIHFDVKRTNARVNWAGEVFRRRVGTIRSYNPLYTTAAVGPLADEILKNSHIDEYPFASETVFGKLMDYKTYVLGLGVTCRTNGFIHVVDRRFHNRLPIPIYSDRPLKAQISLDGTVIDERSYYYIRSEIRKTIRPDNIERLIRGKSFYRVAEDAAPFYRLDLPAFVEFAALHADRRLRNGRLPVWLENRSLPLTSVA